MSFPVRNCPDKILPIGWLRCRHSAAALAERGIRNVPQIAAKKATQTGVPVLLKPTLASRQTFLSGCASY